MRSNRSTFPRLALLSVLLFAASGCAMMFARERMPDTSKITAGAPRAEVEKEFGPPVSDIPINMGRGAHRKVTYKVLVKNHAERDASTANKVADSFVGFQTFEYLVTYDRSDRVASVHQVIRSE